ncbi:hypothetical protein NKG05_09085 [Oerskovia sp. M15]
MSYRPLIASVVGLSLAGDYDWGTSRSWAAASSPASSSSRRARPAPHGLQPRREGRHHPDPVRLTPSG